MAKSSSAQALEQVEFGSVDSRSNPLNMPRNRALRNLNWTVKPGGWLELRQGYSIITQSSVVVSTIHTLIPYTQFDQTRYVIRFQGTTPYQVAIATGAVTGPTFGTGASFTSSNRGQFYQYNNHLYYGNGVDQLWFDGVTWRKSGIPALTSTQVAGIQTASYDLEITAAQVTAISLTQAAGGSFQVTQFDGYAWYVIFFDYFSQALAPGTRMVARQKVTSANQQFQFTGLPNTTGAHTVKLFAWAGDSKSQAFFSTAAAAINISSIVKVSTVFTVTTAAAHGLSTGDVVIIAGVSDAKHNSVWSVVSTGANTFTVTLIDANLVGVSVGAGGTVTKLVFVTEAVTSANITATTQDTSIIANEPNRGIPASTIGGANPGFQFYASAYNPVAGQHVGNRIPIGPRVVPVSRTLIFIYNLPALADPEWVWLIGRTGDGLQVPFVCMDSAGNWMTIPNGTINFFLRDFGALDGSAELPFRNFAVPATCDKFAVVGDYVYAADSISPTIRRCGSALQARNGQFVGDVAQSWDPADIETFPTNQTPVLLAETDGMLFIATRTDCGFLVDNIGTLMWLGPYTKGGAGPRAWVKTDHGFFWVSFDLELCTVVDGKPMAVSDEYNAGELSLLGDAFKSTIEMRYFRSRVLDRDELIIFGQKSDGTPHKVVVDFKLNDERSPWGQARGEEHLGPLATAYTTVEVIDKNNVRQVWAGATDGNLYQFYSGDNDLGQEYTADTLFLVATGLERPQLSNIDIFCDSNIQVQYGRELNSTLDQGLPTDLVPLTSVEAAPTQVPGRSDLVCWRVPPTDPELLGHVYLRFLLTSHSTDGTLALSSPVPHVPLEAYGRIYMIAPMIGDERGRA